MIVVFVTCRDRAEAERIAFALVEERLAACVNVVPSAVSIYRWQGAVERAEEAWMIIKTTRERFAALEKRIRQLHSYEVPEVVALEVVSVSEPYGRWLRECVE
jgi:periplasmic divalent cation tolerance protein